MVGLLPGFLSGHSAICPNFSHYKKGFILKRRLYSEPFTLCYIVSYYCIPRISLRLGKIIPKAIRKVPTNFSIVFAGINRFSAWPGPVYYRPGLASNFCANNSGMTFLARIKLWEGVRQGYTLKWLKTRYRAFKRYRHIWRDLRRPTDGPGLASKSHANSESQAIYFYKQKPCQFQKSSDLFC